MSQSRAQADPLWPMFAGGLIALASVLMLQFYPVAWLSAGAQFAVGWLLLAASVVVLAWATQLAHGWWQKRGEAA